MKLIGSFLTLLTSFFIFAHTASAAPVISVDKPTFNFGTIVQGKKVDHTFIIRNSGDSPLKIAQIRPACGCTAANISTREIQPNKSAEIKVTFNSANFSNAVSKTIAVETNDPKNPSYTLTMAGTITEEIVITPKQINLGQVKIETTKNQSVSLENKGTKPLKLLAIRSPMPQVAIKSDKTLLKPGETATIMISVTPRSEDRILSGYLAIATDNPAKPEIMIPLYGSLTR